jgi:hypothetical protein
MRDIMTSPIPKSVFEICTIKQLPEDKWIHAASQAIAINPANGTAIHMLQDVIPQALIPREHLALLTQKYWGPAGVGLTVGFLDNPPADLRTRILSHMNAWNGTANVRFVEAASNAQVRIARTPDEGYWSNLGTDILSIDDPNQPTMNLASFSMNTEDSEFYRVIRHETGHTLGFPHEHRRRQIVDRIDREKAIDYFYKRLIWSPNKVIEQVLTPFEKSALMATANADAQSIMCYWLPASIMKDGVAVLGGADSDGMDGQFAASVYPKQGGAVVTVYEDANFLGNSASLGVGRYDLEQLGIANDSLSSLRVPIGMAVTLYEDWDFGGRSMTFAQDAIYVGDDFNDITSSIIVRSGGAADGLAG